jgi:hypothetical protein
MDIRYTYAQALFGFFGGIIVVHWFAAPWWAYALGAPAMSAMSYVLAVRHLRALGMKPSILFVDFIAELKRRWEQDGDLLN